MKETILRNKNNILIVLGLLLLAVISAIGSYHFVVHELIEPCANVKIGKTAHPSQSELTSQPSTGTAAEPASVNTKE